jgi:ABC-2 type transport system ATP-binding protein
VIAFDHVGKRYRSLLGREVRALEDFSIELRAGEVFGLAGPNGAGKSTLIKLLCGLITPDEGTIRIAGYDLVREEVFARGQLAYVPDVPNLYPELTVLEHLELVARAHRNLTNFRSDSEALLRRFGLWEARFNPTFALSRGMVQKVAICAAFVRPSQVLLMDEPGGSLDIGSLDELYKILRDYRDYGGTALLSSHQWETLEDFCDTFVLLAPGKAIAGNLPFLREEAGVEEEANLREVYLAYMAAGHRRGHRIAAEAGNLLAHMEP